jgi:hypothetical protein
MAGWKEEYIKTYYHKDGKCLNCGFDSDLCVCDLPVLEVEKETIVIYKTLKWNRDLKFTTDEGKEIPMYNSERTDGQFRFCCPPETVYKLLWRAWIEMQPGMYSGYGKATAEEIAGSLRASCVSEEAAEWAARKADEYYKDKIGLEDFAKIFKGEKL